MGSFSQQSTDFNPIQPSSPTCWPVAPGLLRQACFLGCLGCFLVGLRPQTSIFRLEQWTKNPWCLVFFVGHWVRPCFSKDRNPSLHRRGTERNAPAGHPPGPARTRVGVEWGGVASAPAQCAPGSSRGSTERPIWEDQDTGASHRRDWERFFVVSESHW